MDGSSLCRTRIGLVCRSIPYVASAFGEELEVGHRRVVVEWW